MRLERVGHQQDGRRASGQGSGLGHFANHAHTWRIASSSVAPWPRMARSSSRGVQASALATPPGAGENAPSGRQGANTMHGKPLPVAQAYILCQTIYEDRRTGDFVLVGPFGGIRFERFPGAYRFSLYTQLTNGHGAYQMGLRLRD